MHVYKAHERFANYDFYSGEFWVELVGVHLIGI